MYSIIQYKKKMFTFMILITHYNVYILDQWGWYKGIKHYIKSVNNMY